jgi:hypothetical protein
LIFSLYRPKDRGRTGARTGAASFFHVRTAFGTKIWCGSSYGSDSDAYPLTFLVKKSKILYQFLIFSLYKPKDRGRSWSRSKNRSRIIFWCQNCTKMMRLWFWLQLRRLSVGLCSEKIKKNYINLWFFHYTGQGQGRTGARTGAVPYFYVGASPTWCSSILAPTQTPFLWLI